MSVKSPVTNLNNTSLILEMNTAAIKKHYEQETKVNVDRFFEGISTIQLYQCNDTGYRFYMPDHIWGDGKFYEDLQRKNSWYYSTDRWEHREGIQRINNNDKVLEIGCGDGVFLKMMQQKGVASFTALELNEKAAQGLQNEGLNVIVENIETYAAKHEGIYDVVCFYQVLEHIYNIKSFIDAALRTLKIGGRLIIAVPFNNPYLYRYDVHHTLNLPPHHSGLWDKAAFENLPRFFSMKLNAVKIMPLKEYKEWYKVQIEHYKKTQPVKAFLMSLVPAPIYKLIIAARKTEGRNILVEFIKQ